LTFYKSEMLWFDCRFFCFLSRSFFRNTWGTAGDMFNNQNHNTNLHCYTMLLKLDSVHKW
jgi:hypothetical protein